MKLRIRPTQQNIVFAIFLVMEDQSLHGHDGQLWLGGMTWAGLFLGAVSFLVLIFAVAGFAATAALDDHHTRQAPSPLS